LQTIIVEGLPPKYNGFLFGWNSKSSADKLMATEELISAQDEEVATSTTRKGKAQKKTKAKDNSPKFEGQCFYCKKTGHRKFECHNLKMI